MIAVDALQQHPTAAVSRRYGVSAWCHLFDTDNDRLALMQFALHIGCRADWLQDDPRLVHFDLTPGMRAKAVRAGAVELDRETFVGVVLGNLAKRKEATP